MFKGIMKSEAVQRMVESTNRDDVMDVLVPGLDDPTANGHIEDCGTGEVLILLEAGNITYMAPCMITEALDAAAAVDAMIAALPGNGYPGYVGRSVMTCPTE